MSDNPDFQEDINLDAQSIPELVVNTARLGAQEQTSEVITRTGTVPGSGGSETVTLSPPPGTVRQIVSVGFFTLPVTGSSSVTHEVQFRTLPADSVVLSYRAQADQLLVVTHTRPGSTVTNVTPSTAIARLESVKLLQATDSNPVELVYINRDADDQTADREYRILSKTTQV